MPLHLGLYLAHRLIYMQLFVTTFSPEDIIVSRYELQRYSNGGDIFMGLETITG